MCSASEIADHYRDQGAELPKRSGGTEGATYTTGRLLPETLKAVLDASLADADPVTGFTGLKADPGKANLENILTAAVRI